MNILLTGHTGYIGAVLTSRLLDDGHFVRGISRTKALFSTSKRFEEISKDIRDISIKDLKEIDAIIHLAAIAKDFLYLPKQDIININYNASLLLAKLARKAGVSRFIFPSSSLLYGTVDNKPILENDHVNPLTPYSQAKLDVEKALSSLANVGFHPICIRLATLYGVSPNMRSDLVVNNLVLNAAKSGEILLKSDGQAYRSFIHIDDMSKVCIHLLKAPVSSIHNEIFNVGHPIEHIKIIDLAKLVVARIPKSRIVFSENAGKDNRNIKINSDKLFDTFPALNLDWNLEKGIEALYAYYKVLFPAK